MQLPGHPEGLDRSTHCGAPTTGDGTRFRLGTTGYCFSGRGWIVAPLGIALPIVATYLSILWLYDLFYLPVAIFLPLGGGWIVAGTTCWILGRVWNRDRISHAFLGFRVESWGLFYFIPGLLMLLPMLCLGFLNGLPPVGFGEVFAVILGLAAGGSLLLQLATMLIGSAFLFVWAPIFAVKTIRRLAPRV
jgi:hypothetical protein